MHFSKKIKVGAFSLASESFKFFLLKKCVIIVDLPIIYKSNRNYIYFVHYITSTYYTVVKHSNFNTTHDPQHSMSIINNQTLTQSTQVK
jgi:hypothetical protein